MNAADVSAARTAAVGATIERIRSLEQAAIRESGRITRAALDRIKQEMLALAAQEQLFPSSEFPPPPAGEKGSRRYLLREDPDNRLALYMNALNPGNETRPHDHTTWAVVVAVQGQELNRVYRRTDPGGREGEARLQLDREVMVEPGRGIALMPEDIHSIHTTGTVPTRHLHMYGLALERLDDRVGYDLQAGTVQPYNQAFMKPNATR
ncbi:MAG: cysteine dioxygenase family protein [Acidisphaera sp.]|nr:cysteine dioxygenase family protein [Acidisphaera sp.]